MKTVYLGITGNIIHPRIINIINEDAKLGELTIGLLTDSAIVSHKRLPYLIYEQREKVVENIKGVSRVVPQEDWNYVPNLKKYKPDYIIHGDDWKSNYFSKITTPERRKNSPRKSARIKTIQKFVRHTKIDNRGGNYVLFG